MLSMKRLHLSPKPLHEPPRAMRTPTPTIRPTSTITTTSSASLLARTKHTLRPLDIEHNLIESILDIAQHAVAVPVPALLPERAHHRGRNLLELLDGQPGRARRQLVLES